MQLMFVLTGWGEGSRERLNQVGLVLHDQAQCYEVHDDTFRDDTMMCMVDVGGVKGTCYVCYPCFFLF